MLPKKYHPVRVLNTNEEFVFAADFIESENPDLAFLLILGSTLELDELAETLIWDGREFLIEMDGYLRRAQVSGVSLGERIGIRLL